MNAYQLCILKDPATLKLYKFPSKKMKAPIFPTALPAFNPGQSGSPIRIDMFPWGTDE